MNLLSANQIINRIKKNSMQSTDKPTNTEIENTSRRVNNDVADKSTQRRHDETTKKNKQIVVCALNRTRIILLLLAAVWGPGMVGCIALGEPRAALTAAIVWIISSGVAMIAHIAIIQSVVMVANNIDERMTPNVQSSGTRDQMT